MFETMKRMTLAVMLAAASLVVASPAEARDRYRDRGDDAAIAIGAGIIGLAVGAAIASGNRDRHWRDRHWRGGGYYRGYPNYRYDAYPRYRGDYYRNYRRDWRRDDRNWNRRDWNRGYHNRRYYRY